MEGCLGLVEDVVHTVKKKVVSIFETKFGAGLNNIGFSLV